MTNGPETETGGQPHPDSEGISYRWERRYFTPASRYLFYVLRKGRNGTEKVMGKYYQRDSADDVVKILNGNAPMEVL